MTEYKYVNYLYLICHPNQALVASQYAPEKFARHYSAGSTRYYDGKILFAELDINFRNPYFNIEKGIEELVPHEDGRPKATKFISTYRVLEHIDFNSIKKMYMSNPDGTCYGLESAPYDKTHQPDFLRIFAELAPLKMLVLSKYDFSQYGKWITSPDNPKGAPKVLYTQVDLNIADFLDDFEVNPLMPPPLPSLHPSKLRDAITELQREKNKNTKGLSLDISFNKKSFRSVRHGFMFAAQDQELFFPMPDFSIIEKENYKFFRSM